MTRADDISVVLPTIGRPQLLARALRSIFSQTHQPAEIVVVVDGRHDDAIEALKSFDDPRLRIVQLDQNVGCSSARNAGVEHSSGQWIAFLDDDDEWLPDKLAVQIQIARDAKIKWPIVAARATIRTGNVDLVWPRRLPRPGEPMCNYLFRRTLPLAGEGAVTTPSILAPRELLRRVPFTTGLRRLDDVDWLLRVTREPGVEVIFPQALDPLLICYTDMGRAHASTDGGWRDSLIWGRANRHLFTREAYAGFICANVSARAGRSGERGVFAEVLSEARRSGRMSWVDLTSHVMNFLITRQTRDAVWRMLKHLKRG